MATEFNQVHDWSLKITKSLYYDWNVVEQVELTKKVLAMFEQ